MMNCQEATRLLSDACERPLTFTERLALKFHLAMCSGCRRFGVHVDVLGRWAKAYAKGKGEPPEAQQQTDETQRASRT